METSQDRPVVVVEDDISLNRAIGRILRTAGRWPELFTSAELLLETDLATRSECLVLDIGLPGMSGIELYRELIQRGIRRPVVFITALDSPWVQTEAMRAGASALLQKPFPGMDLLEAVRAAVEGDVGETLLPPS